MQALTTIEYADAYFESKLNTESWDKADESTKNKLLCEATRRIYSIQGFAYTPQAIELLTAVPDDLQQACCEIALNLSSDFAGEAQTHVNNRKLGISSYSYNSESVSYSSTAGSDVDTGIDSVIFSDYALSLLNKYIQKSCRYI